MDRSTTSGTLPTRRRRETERMEPPGATVPRPAAHRGAPRDVAVRAPASHTRVGCDVVELQRLELVLARNPPELRDQLFTAADRQGAASTEELARRFAVKEATLKAVGIGLVGGIHLADIEVTAGADARWHVRLHGALGLLARGCQIRARAW